MHKTLIDENLLLKIIKYTPSLFLLIVAVLITIYLSYENQHNLNVEKENIKAEYIESNKQRVKLNIETISKYIDRTIIKSDDLLREDLREKINLADKIATNIYNKNRDSLSREEIIEHIKNALENFRFNEGRGYFSIHTMQGVNVLHPIYKEFEGTSVLKREDAYRNYPVQEAIKIAKEKGEGFFSWSYFKPDDKSQEFHKMGIVKKFEPLDLIITTAEYTEDYDKNLQEELLEYLKNIEYKDAGYIFVLSNQGDMLVTKTSLSNISQIGDNSFTDQYSKFINSKKEDTYIEYMFENSKKSYLKISYLKKIEPLDWIIGTGFNLDKLNQKIIKRQSELIKEYEENLYATLLIIFVMTLLLLVASIFVSKFSGDLFKNYRDTLNKKNTILRNAQSQAKIGHWEQSLNDDTLFWSDEVYKMFELDPKRAITFEVFMSIVHPDDREAMSFAFEKSVEDHTEYYFEHRLLFDDGHIKYIVERAEHFYDENNRHISTLGTAQDVTELKNKDQMIINQSRHATMGEMIGMIAHQWRQPLSVISMDANNMLVDISMEEIDTETFEAYLHNITKQTQHLSHTIDDFRNFFKLDKEILTVNISDILDQTLSIVKDTLKNNNIEIKSSFETQREVDVYPREIMQVFINIITNAKDALVSNKVEEAEISIRVYEEGKYVKIEISDNGGGIDAAILSKVFDPYFSTKGDMNGTGLGLYMSKIIIEEHLAGIIHAQNKEDGVCFTVGLC